MGAQFQIGVKRSYPEGTRVSCNEYEDADWQVIRIKGGHALIEWQEVRTEEERL